MNNNDVDPLPLFVRYLNFPQNQLGQWFEFGDFFFEKCDHTLLFFCYLLYGVLLPEAYRIVRFWVFSPGKIYFGFIKHSPG